MDRLISIIMLLLDSPRGYHSLLYMGEHCECLAPERVRSYIAERARAMARLYQVRQRPWAPPKPANL